MFILCNHSLSSPLFQQSFALRICLICTTILLQSTKAVVKVQKALRMARGVMAGGGTRGHGPPTSSKSFDSRKFSASSENVRTCAVSIDKSLEFYRKIIEIRSPTLQVPHSGATTPLRMAP